jgi:hypothetical protein
MEDTVKNQQFTDAHLKAYANHLMQNYADMTGMPKYDFKVSFEPGSKYIRVVWTYGVYGSRSAHSFIDAQGNIWKSASWKAPAKNFIRGNILTSDFSRISWTGAR